MGNFVYRYTNKDTKEVVYIGITSGENPLPRINAHKYDSWYREDTFDIDFFPCKTRSEAEAWESHLIALYDTGKHFNKAKVGWGINTFLQADKIEWVNLDRATEFTFEKDTLAFIKKLYDTLKGKKDRVLWEEKTRGYPTEALEGDLDWMIDSAFVNCKITI